MSENRSAGRRPAPWLPDYLKQLNGLKAIAELAQCLVMQLSVLPIKGKHWNLKDNPGHCQPVVNAINVAMRLESVLLC